MQGQPEKIKNTKRLVRNLGRLMWCALGATIGIGLALWLVGIPANPFLLASLGGTTIFLFGLTRFAAAQPRAVFGGHISGALIGIVCFQMFGDGLWVYVLAEVAAFIFMMLTRTVHPPAGANPLIMVHQHAGLLALWQPVGLGIITLTIVAMVWSRLLSNMHPYPVKWLEKSPHSILWGSWRD